MHDIRFIREHPQAFDAGLAARGLGALADSILADDAQARATQHRLQELLAERNDVKELGLIG